MSTLAPSLWIVGFEAELERAFCEEGLALGVIVVPRSAADILNQHSAVVTAPAATAVLIRTHIDEVTELVRTARAHFPDTLRILVMDSHEPDNRAWSPRDFVIRAVVHASDRPGIRTLLRGLASADETSFSHWCVEHTATRTAPGAMTAVAVAEGWARRMARIPGSVLRDPRADSDLVEIVVPVGDALELLRERISRSHPAHRAQRRWRESFHAIHDASDAAPTGWLVFRPWRDGTHVTAAVWFPSNPSANQKVRDAARAVTNTGRGTVLEDDELSTYDPKREQIIARDYVGPDRRQRATPFWSRFTVLGRRRHVPKILLRLEGGAFLDGFDRRLWPPALLVLLFAAVDGLLTARFVERGTVEEQNPLLALALRLGPWWFYGLKALFVGSALGLWMRLAEFRHGRTALWVAVVVYGALDGYWLWLLMR